TDTEYHTLFQAEESPHSSLYKYIYNNRENLSGKYYIFGNQIGTAVANMVGLIDIKRIIAHKISKPGLDILKEKDIELEYNEIIDLVKSSKNTNNVCSLEKLLLNIDNEEALRLMNQKYID
ncbi:DUF1893 domain-containing protein, partial [Tissierellaceae bacterium HCP3S3_D8]